MEGKIVYTVKEVADLLGVSTITVYNMCKEYGFPSIKVGKKKIVILKEKYEKWMEEKINRNE